MEEKTIEQQIREKVEAAKPEIVKDAVDKAVESLKHQISWQVEAKLSEMVNTIFEEDILPELKNKVTEQKPLIVQGLLDGFVDVGAEVAKALTAQATKNLSESWNVGKLSEALFK